jgi:hypothetical protein
MRGVVSYALIFLLPSALLAQETQSAGVVYASGSVYLDGAQLSNSMPVTSGDVIETKDASAAHIDMTGSTAMIEANAVVRSRSGGLALDRGKVTVATGKSLKVFARDFEITPVTTDWTQFQVERSAGLIHIAALKNSVEIKCGMGAPTIIREGHEITRADAQNCGLYAETGATPTVAGPILGSPWAIAASVGAAGGLIFWTLNHNDDAISPDNLSGQP